MLNRRNLLKLFGLGAIEPVINNNPIPTSADVVSVIKHTTGRDVPYLPCRLFIKNGIVFKEESYFMRQDKEDVYDVKYFNELGYHRDGDLPACVFYDGHGKPIGESWYKNGKPFREGGKPTTVYTYKDYKSYVWHDELGRIYKKYNCDGKGITKLYNENGQVKEIVNPDGTKEYFNDEYYARKKHHFITAKDGYGLIYQP